jgi:NADH-quinone oxidoreductase subunit L
MTIPLIVLAILSVVGGFVGLPEVMVPNANWLEHFLQPVFDSGVRQTSEIPASTEWMLMGLSTVLALAMVLFALFRFSKNPELGEPMGIGKWMRDTFYVDKIYDTLIVKPLNALAGFFDRVIENEVIDGVVNGTGRLVQYGSRQLRYLQSGQVGAYVLLMVVGIVILFVVQLFLRK